MRKIWLIAISTYRRRIRSGMFLLFTLGLPLIMVIAGAIPWIQASRESPATSVGYVDQTGQLAPISEVTVEDADFTRTVSFTSYESIDAAETAVQRGDIAGFLVVPDGYFEDQIPTYYGEEEPGPLLDDGLSLFMLRAQLPDAPEWMVNRLENPAKYTFVAQTTGVSVEQGIGVVIRIGLPAVLAVVFGLAVFTGISQMGAVIVREKEQRAMEMVITSLRPRELVAGKVLGMTMLTLTQIAVWSVGGTAALLLYLAQATDVGTISIPWGVFIWAVLLGVPGYFLYALLASGLGILASDSQQAQQMAGILSFAGFVPFWMIGLFIESPDSALAVALTLFPLTAPTLGLFRMTLTQVPTWQLAGAVGILLVSLVATTWVVARIFRAAMLMYGQRPTPKQIWRAMREA